MDKTQNQNTTVENHPHQRYFSMRARIVAATGAALIVASIALPVVQNIVQDRRYAVEQRAQKLLGDVIPSLNKKLTYDNTEQLYQFNRTGEADDTSNFNPAKAAQQAQVGANKSDEAHLYSVDLSKDLSKGVRYYDNQQAVNFSLIPEFDTRAGEMNAGRLVYPLKSVAGQAVYTVQNNGLREDILINKASKEGTLTLGYKLSLPNTLEARAIDGSGAIGIYSADPSLFGDISYGSNNDQQLIMNARQKSPKTNLVFTIPAPVISQAGQGKAPKATMTLNDQSELKIQVSGLDKNASYPLDIDPSVVINSASTFAQGNQEGNIDLGSAITRGGLTGGTIGSWTTNSNPAFTTARYFHGLATYNGYVYIGGGLNGSGALSDMQYAPINSDGSIGTASPGWSSTNSFSGARYGMGMIAYNGYMYIMGGYDGSSYFNDIQYAPINSDGTISSNWTTAATTLPTTRYTFGLVAYNNHLYITGGSNGTIRSDSYYATVNGDGSLSSWTTGASFSTAGSRLKHGMLAYNGYLYILGGNSGGTYYNDVEYAKINADGSYSSWMTTSSFTTGRYSMGVAVYDGYMYIMGGNNNGTLLNDTQYAPINANGSVGTWRTLGSFTNVRYGQGSFAYNGYLYVVGGHNTSPFYNDTQYAKITAAGDVAPSRAGTNLTTTVNQPATVAYNGYLYIIGGNTTGTTATTLTYYAPINTDGSIGSWTSTSAFTTARYATSAVAYNGYIYLLGGYTGSAYSTSVQRSLVAANGSLGAWSSTSLAAMSAAEAYMGAAAYNGNIYLIGGYNGTTRSSTVYRAALSATGTIASWTTTTSINTTVNGGRSGVGIAISGGRIYMLGGGTGATDLTEVQYATFNSNGTLSSWTIAANPMTTARDRFTAGAFDGYLYVAGGTSTGSNYFNDIQFAAIQSNGNVGSWSASATTLTTSRLGNGCAFYNGTMYVLGGNASGTYTNSVEYLPLNNGGSGTAGTWTANATLTSLPAGRYNHGSAAYNGYLYVLAGFNGSSYFTGTTDGLLYAAIGADGSLGSWTASGIALPTNSNGTTKRQNFGMAIYNGYIYMTGGNDSAADLFDTEYIAIGSNGAPTGSWSAGAMLPAGSGGASDGYYGVRTVAANGYLYAIGGSSVTYKNTVYYTALNANGSTGGSWTSTTAFTSPRYEVGAVAYNGYLYIIGGTDDTTIFSDVQYATINANGTLGSWSFGPNLSTARTDFGIAAQNGYMYIMGGFIGGTSYASDVQVASINSDGSLGNWNGTASFATPRAGLRTAIYNGYMYVSGGADNGGNYAYVQDATLNAISRTGSYSRMIDLGAPASILSTLTYAGTTPNTTVMYATAGSNGVFGSAASPSSLNTTTCGYNQGSVRYVYIYVTMDNSQTSTYSDTVAASADTITNITLNYLWGRAPTASRMHDGKYFAGETQLPLDTCGP